MQTNLAILVVAVVVLLIVVAAVALWAKFNRRDRLRDRFGPEYDRAVRQAGSQERAEAVLGQRVEERQRLQISDLRPESKNRYIEEWRALQSGFVDDPAGALSAADALLSAVMRERGYPADDFERGAAMVSVDHGPEVHEYRNAHSLAVESNGSHDIERVRDALIADRRLFERLIGEPVPTEERSSGAAEPTVADRR